jgi:hypothetical protein
MNLWITNDVMTSEDTRHQARLVESGWELSWLPGRVLDRNQAVTGMVLAEAVGDDSDVGSSRWPLISALASELGLSAHDVVAQVAEHDVDLLAQDKGLDDAAEDVCEDGS